jgi:hypothetical protein
VIAGGQPAGSSRAFRLDPFTLPVRHSGPSGGVRETAFVLDRERAIVKRSMRAGQAVTVAVPVHAYDGVAVRMVPIGRAGQIRVIVELRHRDPALTLPLIIADEPEDVAADWQAWGRALNLPLLLIEQDGTVRMPLGRLGAVTVARAKPRRRHSFFAGRRPRFLSRRKPGHARAPEHVAGREIIAPE